MSYLNTLKKYSTLVLALLIVQAGVLVFSWANGHVYTQDSYEYLQQAENLLKEGHWSCGTPLETAADKSLWSRRPPGYAVFILMTSLGLNFPLMTLMAQGILSVFNLTLALYLFIITTKRNPPVLLFTCFFLSFPSQYIYGAHFMSEIPFQTCLLAGAFFLIRFIESRSGRLFLIQQLCWAGAYLLKPVAVFLWIPIGLFCLLKYRSAENHTAILAGTALHILLTGLIILHNNHHTGVAEYSSIGTKLLLNYNIPSIMNTAVGEEACNRYMDSLQIQLGTLNYAVQKKIVIKETIQQYLTHLFSAIGAHIRGMIRFFLEPGRWDLLLLLDGMDAGKSQESLLKIWRDDGVVEMARTILRMNPVYTAYMVAATLSSALLLWLFCLSLINRATPLPYKFLLAALIFYIALLTGPSASARFRLPVFPLMVITAAAFPLMKPSLKPE